MITKRLLKHAKDIGQMTYDNAYSMSKTTPGGEVNEKMAFYMLYLLC